MFKISKIALLLLFLSGSVYSQIIEVRDSLSGKPLGNALIESENNEVFTDENGRFNLGNFRAEDTLKISHISYFSKKVSYGSALRKKIIWLMPRAIEVGEVKVIGNKSLNKATELETKIKVSRETKAGFTKIGDLLRKKTLLFVKDYGGLQTVSSRGMSSENTLVLFNEARVNDLRTGSFNFSNLPPSGIGEIEYVKSSTDGFITSGGIIKLSSGNLNNENFATAGVTLSSNSGQEYFASIKKSTELFNFSFNADRSFSPNKYEYFFENKKHSRQNAFYSKSFLSGEAVWKPGGAVVKFYSHYSHLLSGLPGFVVTNNFSSSKASSLSDVLLGILSADFSLNKSSSWKSVLTFNLQKLAINDPTGEMFYATKFQLSHLNGFSVLNKYMLNGKNYEFTAGHYFNEASVDDIASAVGMKTGKIPAERNENVIMTSFSYKLNFTNIFKEIVFSTGVNYRLLNEEIGRREHYSYLSNAFSLLFSPKGAESLRLILSFKNNYRHPTFNERFYSGLFGNSNLKGEKYHSFDVTVKKIFDFAGGGRFELTYFNIFTNDKIIWVPTRLALQIPRNVSRVKSEGLELSLSQQLLAGFLQYDFRYALTKATNLTPAKRGDNTYGKQIIYVPLHKALLTLSAKYSFFKFSTTGMFVSERYFTPDNTELNSLAPYFLLDFSLSANFKFSHLENMLTLNIYNVTNEKYFVIQSYPMPLKTYSINYQVRFQ